MRNYIKFSQEPDWDIFSMIAASDLTSGIKDKVWIELGCIRSIILRDMIKKVLRNDRI